MCLTLNVVTAAAADNVVAAADAAAAVAVVTAQISAEIRIKIIDYIKNWIIENPESVIV